MTWPPLRGQVIRAHIGLDEPKLFLVVSNNSRNRVLGSVLTVRLTTSKKPNLASIVELDYPEIFVGRACCDDIVEIFDDEYVTTLGGFSPSTMRNIDGGLKAALGM